MAAQAKIKVQAIIDENPVGEFKQPSALNPCIKLTLQPAVFSKSYCPYCKATKALLNEKGAKFYSIELDQVGKLSQLPVYDG